LGGRFPWRHLEFLSWSGVKAAGKESSFLFAKDYQVGVTEAVSVSGRVP
jgi:hypothetical protein